MKILYYHCFAGISGDMNLAAMIDLGVPSDFLKSELAKLNIYGYSIDNKNAVKMGISGTQVNVELTTTKEANLNNLKFDDSHASLHYRTHSHETVHSPESTSAHNHRSFTDIKKIIELSSLSLPVKETSIAIFEKVAVAEGKIHGKPMDEVHFHEVGAIDSIIDIVGAAICYHYLKPGKVLCSSVELGGGFVKCEHGTFPVPAPATVEILKNIPVKLGTVQVETTTPTGAAILATLVDEFTDTPSFKINQTAYGIGHRNMEIPNVLRVHLGETSENLLHETALMLECNIDDMPPEQYEYLIEKILSKGAHDVFLTPVIMKKSRPAVKLSVLCGIAEVYEIQTLLFLESTTLGIRTYPVNKTMLERKMKTVTTKYGKIDVKIAMLNKQELKFKPEYDQCKEAAIRNNIALKTVIEEVIETMKLIKE
jgi:pyridinium-3,5-bisthiocarboxylic acid mononucleotide nickel chelatase